MDIIKQLLGGLGGGMGSKIVGDNLTSRVPFRSMVSIINGDAAYDTVAEVIALITGVAHVDFFKIWQLTVPAQQTYRWGYGSPALQANQGYMWFAALDSGTDWDVGILRLVQANARETASVTVLEMPDNALHTGTVTTIATARPTDRNAMIPLPEKTEFRQVREDSLLQLWYSLTTAATAHDAAGFDIPVSIRQ